MYVKEINLPVYGIKIRTALGGGTITSDIGTGFEQIESMILACAIAGIDVETPAFLEAIETALEAAGNHIDEEEDEEEDEEGEDEDEEVHTYLVTVIDNKTHTYRVCASSEEVARDMVEISGNADADFPRDSVEAEWFVQYVEEVFLAEGAEGWGTMPTSPEE
jgi:hypothetical protein